MLWNMPGMEYAYALCEVLSLESGLLFSFCVFDLACGCGCGVFNQRRLLYPVTSTFRNLLDSAFLL